MSCKLQFCFFVVEFLKTWAHVERKGTLCTGCGRLLCLSRQCKRWPPRPLTDVHTDSVLPDVRTTKKYRDVDVVTMLLRSMTRSCRLFCFFTDSLPV